MLQLVDRSLTSAILRPTINVKKPVMSQPQVMEMIPPYARPVLNVVVMPAITERIEKEIAKFENNLHSMMLMLFKICQCKIIYTLK